MDKPSNKIFEKRNTRKVEYRNLIFKYYLNNDFQDFRMKIVYYKIKRKRRK